jgi:hypothetical protein
VEVGPRHFRRQGVKLNVSKLHPRLSAIEHSGSPLDAITEMLKLIDGTTKGLPDLSKIPPDPDIIDVTRRRLRPSPEGLTKHRSGGCPTIDVAPTLPAPQASDPRRLPNCS